MARLDEFMDRYAPGRGSDPADNLADAGPASRRIAQAIAQRGGPRPELAERVLASLFWWCYVQTDDFELITEDIGERGQRQIVVRHANVAYDLLILSPDVTEPYGIAIGPQDVTSPGGNSGGGGDLSTVALQEGGRMRGMLARAGIDVDVRSAIIAVREVAVRGDFQMVIAPEPAEAPTQAPAPAQPKGSSFAAPVPALAVTRSDVPGPVATAGVIGQTGTGEALVFTAWHAVSSAGDAVKIFVGGAPARVIGGHDLTDSCVLSVSHRAGPGAGRAGLLLFPPAEHRPATFDGAASGHKRTMIRAYDRSVLDPNLYLSSKVYTDPDTIAGDSGAALIDSDDRIVGFAVSRTPLGAPLEFSTWAWAEQVLTAHGLA